jgi:hypothetical protein
VDCAEDNAKYEWNRHVECAEGEHDPQRSRSQENLSQHIEAEE